MKGAACWLLLLCAFASALACSEGDASRAGHSAFHGARDKLIRGTYAGAVQAFEHFLRDYPDSPFRSRAEFLRAKALLGSGDWQAARRAFERTRRLHPRTLEGHKARYKLGVVAWLLGEEARALAAFQALSKAPDGPLAAEATAMVRKLQGTLPPGGP